MQRVQRWFCSRRGVATVVAVVVLVVADSSTLGLSAGGFVVCLILGPVLTLITAAVWEGNNQPATPRFARPAPVGGSRQLREDANARIWSDHGGFLFARRHWFVGTGCPPVRLPAGFASGLQQRAAVEPECVARTEARRYWCYRGVFVWENQDLSARDVMALMHDRDRKRTRGLERAHVLLAVEQGRRAELPRQRQPIPRDVRQAVFVRDGGRCVDCRSDFEIQYDHVIPWSLGGADTIENLQVLCGPCNRAKSDAV